MKVIAITSSPMGKKSNTLKLVNAALKGAAEQGAETEIINIAKAKIKFCKGCHTCYKKGRCAQDDDFQEIFDKVMEADGLILSSPNYVDNVTAQMKVFLDRMTDSIHAQLLDGKYGFALCTAGGGNMEIVNGMMNGFLIKAGGYSLGEAGAAVGRDPASINVAAEKAYEMGKDMVAAIKEKRVYPEQKKLHDLFKENFAYSLVRNKDAWVADYRRWMEKGWIK